MQVYKISQNCFKQMACMLLLGAGSLFAQQPQGSRKASTVSVDPRNGRLVRTVVVAPKVIEPKVITPVEVGGDAAVVPDTAFSEMVEDAARRNGVDPLLVHSVIKAESNYNPKAVSNKGAQGLMQLMPGTARDLGVKNAMDPKDNIEGGVKYLKYLQSQFSDPALALAAYNAGEGAVRRYNWIPPYRETQDYVVKVARNYRQARDQQQARAAASAKAAPVTAAHAAATAPAAPSDPPPAPLQYYYDAQGRLNLRTVNTLHADSTK
jgi:soluble lytic murein transglycosylase-like protein